LTLDPSYAAPVDHIDYALLYIGTGLTSVDGGNTRKFIDFTNGAADISPLFSVKATASALVFDNIEALTGTPKTVTVTSSEPAYFRYTGGTTHLNFHGITPSNPDIWISHSEDNGLTWSSPYNTYGSPYLSQLVSYFSGLASGSLLMITPYSADNTLEVKASNSPSW
jgi:hypothetical protein